MQCTCLLHALCGGRTAQLVPEERTPPPLLVHLALEASSRRWGGGGEETEIPNERERKREIAYPVFGASRCLLLVVTLGTSRVTTALFSHFLRHIEKRAIGD